MTTFYSPDGNPEIWDEKPASYITVEEWEAARAAEAAEAEAARKREAERRERCAAQQGWTKTLTRDADCRGD